MKANHNNFSEVRFEGDFSALKDLYLVLGNAKVNVKPLFKRTHHAREPIITSLIVSLGGAAITKGIAEIIKKYIEENTKDRIHRRQLRFQLIKDYKKVETGKLNELLDLLDK